MAILVLNNKYLTRTLYGENYICLVALFMVKNKSILNTLSIFEEISRHMEREAARKISEVLGKV